MIMSQTRSRPRAADKYLRTAPFGRVSTGQSDGWSHIFASVHALCVLTNSCVALQRSPTMQTLSRERLRSSRFSRCGDLRGDHLTGRRVSAFAVVLRRPRSGHAVIDVRGQPIDLARRNALGQQLGAQRPPGRRRADPPRQALAGHPVRPEVPTAPAFELRTHSALAPPPVLTQGFFIYKPLLTHYKPPSSS